jgi:hypothetical protein
VKNGFRSLLSPILVPLPPLPKGYPARVGSAASGLCRRRSRGAIEIFFLADFGSIFRNAAFFFRNAIFFGMQRSSGCVEVCAAKASLT